MLMAPKVFLTWSDSIRVVQNHQLHLGRDLHGFADLGRGVSLASFIVSCDDR